MSEPEITDEMPAPTQPTGPTEHLSDPEYWRGLYCDAIEVGKEMLAKERAAHPKLTADEVHAMALTADLAGTLRRIIGDGPNAAGDWSECARIIHDIQSRILSQVASRTDPPYCRPLGGWLP